MLKLPSALHTTRMGGLYVSERGQALAECLVHDETASDDLTGQTLIGALRDVLGDG